MTEETCGNCKHSELCHDGCAFFEEKKQGPFRWRHITVGTREHKKSADEVCRRLNEHWAGRENDD